MRDIRCSNGHAAHQEPTAEGEARAGQANSAAVAPSIGTGGRGAGVALRQQQSADFRVDPLFDRRRNRRRESPLRRRPDVGGVGPTGQRGVRLDAGRMGQYRSGGYLRSRGGREPASTTGRCGPQGRGRIEDIGVPEERAGDVEHFTALLDTYADDRDNFATDAERGGFITPEQIQAEQREARQIAGRWNGLGRELGARGRA
jgi:hypothetical protein